MSAAEHEKYLTEHLDQEVAEGLMVKMEEEDFIQAFGENRAVAALAVLVEDEVTGKKRVIHDGTHGVMVNHRIRCRDKVRMPGPREKRALLEEYEAGKQFGSLKSLPLGCFLVGRIHFGSLLHLNCLLPSSPSSSG